MNLIKNVLNKHNPSVFKLFFSYHPSQESKNFLFFSKKIDSLMIDFPEIKYISIFYMLEQDNKTIEIFNFLKNNDSKYNITLSKIYPELYYTDNTLKKILFSKYNEYKKNKKITLKETNYINPYISKCTAILNTIIINNKGDVFPCENCGQKVSLGNLEDNKTKQRLINIVSQKYFFCTYERCFNCNNINNFVKLL